MPTFNNSIRKLHLHQYTAIISIHWNVYNVLQILFPYSCHHIVDTTVRARPEAVNFIALLLGTIIWLLLADMEEVEKGIKIPMKAHTAVAPVSPSHVQFCPEWTVTHTHAHKVFQKPEILCVYPSVCHFLTSEREGWLRGRGVKTKILSCNLYFSEGCAETGSWDVKKISLKL